MKDWPKVTLRDLAVTFADGDWIESKDQSSSGIRIVQTGNIGSGEFKDNEHRARFIDVATFERLRCSEVVAGDVLISRLPDPIGRACIVPSLSAKLVTAVDCTIVRFRGEILPEFFVYYSGSLEYLRKVRDQSTGSTRQRISRKNLADISVPLPPLDEQKRIVAKLDEATWMLDQATELSRHVNILNMELWEASLNAEFFILKEEAMSATVGQLFKTSSGGTPLKSRKDYHEDGAIPWLLSGEVGQRLILGAKKSVTDLALKETSVKWVPADSVLVAMYGATAGEVGLLDVPLTTNQAVCAIHPNSDYNPRFVYYAILHAQKTLIALSSGNAQPNVSQQKIQSLEFPVVERDRQDRLVEKLDALWGKIELNCSVRAEQQDLLNLCGESLSSTILAGDL